MDETIARELTAMARRDLEMRARLARSGALFDGYHRDMQALHEANAARLLAIAEQAGWPVAAKVGEEAAQAAWLIAQHAISRPDAMRRFATLLEEAVARGAAPGWQLAMLTDRIRVLENRPQLYGTQFDWNEAGEMAPNPIEDEAGVDARRAELGLNTLAERAAELRARAAEEGEAPPEDMAARRAEAERWAEATGWRKVAAT
jgi:hypothetical protein